MTITWAYPAFLLLIPLLLALFLVRRRQHVRSQVARPKVKHLLASPSGVSKSVEPASLARRGGGWLGLIALCLTAVALARPQWGEIEQRTYERSREVIIALDLSRSMLATDVPPSRLDRAKLLVDSLVKELEGERVGLVVFAGTSFVQYPLSNDYEVLREMLKEVNPSFLPQQGTDFGKLLQTAYKAFDFSSSSDRFLIVLSDGEDLAGDWETELGKFQEAKIHIISLGIGTAAGSVLPETGGGVIKDEKGAVVLSRLDSTVLQELATKTAGRYVDAYRWVDLPQIIAQTVAQGEKGEFAKKQQILKVERFQIPLGLALFFAFLSLWRDFPVYPRHSIKKPSQLEKSLGKHAAKKSKAPIVPTIAALLLALTLPLSAQELAAPEGPASAPAQPKPGEVLSSTVQSFSSLDIMSAPDYAKFAEATIGYGKAMQQAKDTIEMGAVDDALLGVDEGEGLDSKAADWPKLRKELEELKKKSSDQQQQKQDQKKQDKKDQDKNQKQDQQKQNSGGSGGQDKDKDKDKQQGQDSKSDQNSGKDQKQQDQKNQDSKNQQSGQNGQDQQKPSQGQNEPKDGKDPKDQDPQQNQGQNPKDEKDKQDAQNQPKPDPTGSPSQKEPQPQKSVGGGGSSGQKKDKDESQDAESIEMARKLDQIKQNDSPGKIYQLFSPPEPRKDVKGKTW